MNDEQLSITQRAIRSYGGGFIQAIGDALSRADTTNRAALLQAFGPHGTGGLCPYLPGGWCYQEELNRFHREALTR